MRTIAFFYILLTVIASGCVAIRQAVNPSTLAGIDQRGKLLYAYDVACIIATDTLFTTKPDSSLMGMFLAKLTDSSWSVAFGRSSESSDQFLISYKVDLSPRMVVTDMHTFSPPLADTGFFLKASRAVDLTRNNYDFPKHPYNYYVFPDTGDYLAVYFIPAQVETNSNPIGQDVRYLVSSDGSRIIQKLQLHKSLIEMGSTPPNVESSMHTHILSDLPVDTDVFYVLRQRPRLPHYIITRNYIFVIDPDGNITPTEK
jgi:hypothetical protein